jgi:hypothetical protein
MAVTPQVPLDTATEPAVWHGEAAMTEPATAQPFPWRSPAVWLSALIAVMMAYNAWQALSDPAAFATRFGLAGAADVDTGFIRVYASRALFLALVTAVLLAARQFRALGLFALVAVVMPVADALQVSAASGPQSIVVRHVVIAIYLIATGALLLRLAHSRTRPA